MRRLNLIGLVLVSLFLALPLDAPYAQQQQSVRVATTTPAPSSYFGSERSAAERITADEMKEILYYIASDDMLGRDTPSPGLDKTAQYIADHLKKFKLKPAGDNGTYFQHITLSRTQVDRENTKARLGDKTFKVGEDFLPVGRVSGDAEGQVVYAGHGWVINSKNVNAYDGLDVRDKIVVVSGDGTTPPQGFSVENLPGTDWESPVSYAQKHGAKALVLIPRNFERRWRFGPNALTRSALSVPRLENAADDEDEDEAEAAPPKGLVEILPSRAMLSALFAGEQTDGARVLQASIAGEQLKGFALSPSKRLSLSVKLSVTEASTQNVVAVLEGKDSTLKKEYVALGAHYDHVGTNNPGCRPVGDDKICNGADDDGSGTTTLITMAEAFSNGPRPQRSILFVWHTGQANGLWGSEYFTRFPTIPLKQIAAQLNIDMIGRSRKPGDTNPANKMLTAADEIYVVGSTLMSTELQQTSEGVNSAYLKLNFNYHYDEPNDPERMYSRSDHYNYAKHGIPIIFYFDGVHEDYHRPTDSPDKIDYEKMQRVTRTVFITASELANAPHRPVVDKKLPSENAGR